MSLTVASKLQEERLFVGLPIPDEVVEKLASKLDHYKQLIKKSIPRENWHITVLFIGEVDLTDDEREVLAKAMPQTFMPAVTLTHVGRGLNGKQLWAYAKTTKVMDMMRGQVYDRVNGIGAIKQKLVDEQREFVPHITLANLRLGPNAKLIADEPVSAMWRADKLLVYRSRFLSTGVQYSIEKEISLVA